MITLLQWDSSNREMLSSWADSSRVVLAPSHCRLVTEAWHTGSCFHDASSLIKILLQYDQVDNYPVPAETEAPCTKWLWGKDLRDGAGRGLAASCSAAAGEAGRQVGDVVGAAHRADGGGEAAAVTDALSVWCLLLHQWPAWKQTHTNTQLVILCSL